MFSLAREMMIAILRIILYIFLLYQELGLYQLNDIRINDRELKRGVACFVDKKIIFNDPHRIGSDNSSGKNRGSDYVISLWLLISRINTQKSTENVERKCLEKKILIKFLQRY